MKSRYSLRLIFLLTVIGIIIFGFIAFGIFIIYRATSSIGIMGIWIGLLFLWLGSGYLVLIVGKIKNIQLLDGKLILKKPFINKRIEEELQNVKYTPFEWEMTWNTMRGILIKVNDNIEQISLREYSNSKDLIGIITKTSQRDDNLKLNIWTKELKLFLFFGLIILIGFLSTKFQ